jgi:parallel beta helix pectate lyase-like protein
MARAFKKALCRVGLFSLVLGGGALVVPSIAAANPACGKVVTNNVTLTANMNCNGGNSNGQIAALFAGANGITINLNGFNIVGNGGVSRGIDNTGSWNSNAPGSGGTSGPGTGFNRVTVENGTVRDFDHVGIYAADAQSMKITNVNSYGQSDVGLNITETNKTSITGSHIGNQNDPNGRDGCECSDNLAMTVSSSTFNWNGSEGFDDFNSQATLNGVKFNHNSDQGFLVDEPVAPYLVENSKANNNGDTGFEAEANHFNTITFNNNNSENNNGWGYFAEVFAHGTNNGFENDSSGGCHNVGGCHLNP